MPREKDEELVFTNKVDEHYMLQKRNKVRLEKKIRSNAWILRLLFVACLGGYLFSDFSKVKCLSVSGNEVYTKDYVIEDSGLSLESRYYLFVPIIVERKLEENSLIEKAEVMRRGDNIVSLQITEKKVVASYLSDELSYLCNDGSVVKVDQSNLSYMAKVPYIVGLEENGDLLVKLAKQLDQVNSDVLSMMSEIVWYPLDYDEAQLKVNMVDQNYVFVAVNDISMINDYRKIATTLSESGKCIYFDSNATHAYLSECLFDIVDVEENEDNVATGVDINGN